MLIRLHDILLIQIFRVDFLRVSACSDTLASITKLIESLGSLHALTEIRAERSVLKRNKMLLRSLLLITTAKCTVVETAERGSWVTPSNQGENRNVIVEMIKWKVG